MILGNTYHLYLRPGAERIDRLGGLHRFMSWSRGILTDSGGFQVMSLSSLRRVDEDGVGFRSHLDGSTHRLTPERAIQIQELLGSDVAMVLGRVPPLPGPAPGGGGGEPQPDGTLGRAGLRAHRRHDQLLFGIVQGGMEPDLRRQAARHLAQMDFAGYGIGGLSVGEPKELMYQLLDVITPELPPTGPAT